MVRIVATSDFHGQLPEIPECDLLLICGDICPNQHLGYQALWLDVPFRNWLKQVPAKEIVGIAGNHDFIFAKEDHLVPPGLRWHYLKDSSIELFGLKIFGTPWQLPFYGIFNLDEEKLEKQYSTVPKDIDIFISHAPPFGIFDEVPRKGPADFMEHTGSVSLRNKVLEIQPKLFVCGHIHCSPGICKIDKTTFANVSLLDDHMKATNPPVLFNIE